MILHGGINFDQGGINSSIRTMHLQTTLFDNASRNISGFGKVGYQRKVPVVSSFSELVGVHGLSEITDTTVGRLRQTLKPLDFALAKDGYFQYKTPNGIKPTRDGRFKLDKQGNLLTLEGHHVLSNTGEPIKFSKVPKDLKNIKIDDEGNITFVEPDTQIIHKVGKFSVVSIDGKPLPEVVIKQGFTEDSNVRLHSEFLGLVPIRRNFEANRQLYIMQNDALSKTISELGKP